MRGTNAEAVIRRLDPIIRGWAAYYRGVVSKEVFTALIHHSIARSKSRRTVVGFHVRTGSVVAAFAVVVNLEFTEGIEQASAGKAEFFIATRRLNAAEEAIMGTGQQQAAGATAKLRMVQGCDPNTATIFMPGASDR
ncbi:group II intron maturase-specific domain-containing protein [Rathayibacter soli]|uniref:group II intron maturase-specific domain-containing protein n=1 Tax=Rathayibacter soli TaxID=3144168 RepID=UPI0027E511CB|nr:group II intron maturase-specific domain-containing protein [Glaciibacter superstes]